MSEQLGKEFGRVLYFDPNNVTVNSDTGDNLTAIFNGLEIMKDPENYAIAVDLEVINKDRDSVTIGSVKVDNTSANASVSNFLGGSNIGDSKVLTSFFDDITYSGEEPHVVNEAMNIESIDISFNSWYVASVIIKFTDVRGASLFSPTEYNVNQNNGDQIQSDGNLFSGFFTMPYPIFKLKIKGFYGDSVTYPLHCTDFKAEFNNEKGNFDITTHFIGYTYAMLSDIQMTFLLTAPHTKGRGDIYWDKQVKNGRFRTFEGDNLPKIDELMKRLKKGENLISDVNGSNQNVKELETLKNEQSSINDIQNTITLYETELLSKKYNFIIKDKSKKHILSTINSLVNLDISSGSSYSTLVNNLSLKISNHINKFKDSEVFIKFKNDSDKAKQLSDIKKYIQANNILKAINWSGIVDLTDISDSIFNHSVIIKKKEEDLVTKVASTVADKQKETYQMTPSIYNFIKILMAHMETLLHIIAETAQSAQSDTSRVLSNGSHLTDIRDSKLSPFCWLTVDNKDEWFGNFPEYQNFPEVSLVKSFIRAEAELAKEIKTIESTVINKNIASDDSNINIGNIWFPINAFDNSISIYGVTNTTPYSKLLMDNGLDIGELKALLSSRIATIIGLSSLNNSISNLESFGLSESRNIIEQIGKTPDQIALVKQALKEINGSLVTSTVDKKTGVDKYSLLKKTSDGNRYEYKLLSTSGVLPLSSESIKSLEYKISIKKGIFNHFNFYADKNGVTGTEVNIKNSLINNSSNFDIIEGSDNCDKVFNEWYTPIINKIGADKNIESSLSNYKLNVSDYKLSILNDTCTEQLLMNRICKKIKTDFNSNDHKELNTAFHNVGIDNNVPRNDNVIQPRDKFPLQLNLTGNTGDNQIPRIKIIDNKNFKDNFYKLYLGLPIKEGLKDVNIKNSLNRSDYLKLKNNIEDLTYPMVGGTFNDSDGVKIPISLFGTPTYYAQNNGIDNLKMHSEAKAFLFLQTLPINIETISEKMLSDKTSFMSRMTKAEALLLGSMLWRKKNERGVEGNSTIKPKNGKLIIPSVNMYFRVAGKFKLNNYNNYKGYFNSDDTIYDTCDLIKSMDPNSKLSELLINLFEKWVSTNDPSQIDSWQKIRFNLELRGKDENNKINNFNDSKFIDVIGKINNQYTFETIKSEIHPDIIKNYITIEPINNSEVLLINNDINPGVKGILNLLFNECIIMYSGDANIIDHPFGINSNLDVKKVNDLITIISGNLYNKKKEIENSTNFNSSSSIALEAENNDGINLETYRYLKTLYDKWVSGYEFNTDDSKYKWIDTKETMINGISTYNMSNFKFIDRSYNNIGDKFIIDLQQTVDKFIGLSEKKTLYSSITDILTDNQYLFLPMPNYQSWNTVDDFAKIFQPIPYIKSNISKIVEKPEDEWTSIFLCMYTGAPSKSLNINTKSYMYSDDSLNLNLNETTDIPSDYSSSGQNDISDTDTGVMNKVPAFAISYGKQNQSYFKKISLNMANPTTTEASISALKNLIQKSDKDSAAQTIGQNLYSIYSAYAYTCDIEMMGCAQIQPMMYFQLTNVPMWNGAYLIYKVSHSIRPGSMKTTMTGMRMSNNYPKLLVPGSIGYNISNLGGTSVAQKNNTISNFNPDSKIGRTFTLRQYTTKDFNNGKKMESLIYDYVVTRLENNVAPTIDEIYDSWMASDLNKGYGPFKITSGYDATRSNKKSQHLEALAVDIQIANKPTFEKNNALFEFIKGKMRGGLKIDQLIRETNGGDNGGWCHVSPVGLRDGSVKISGESFYLIQQTNEISNMEIIENAKGAGKLTNMTKDLENYLTYLKKGENNKNAKDSGWISNENRWKPIKSNTEIAYGIVFMLDGKINARTQELKNIINSNINNLSNIRITDETATSEMASQVEAGLVSIKKYIDRKYGANSFNNIDYKYRYAIFDLYYNYGSGKYNASDHTNNILFINEAVKNNLNGMLRYSDRINYSTGEIYQRRSNLFREYLNS